MTITYVVLGFIAVLIILKVLSNSSSIETIETPTEEDIKDYLRNGKKLHAIKCYRKMTGVGLKDAKEAVEKMEL